ncbi:hypothetical protein Moror_9881 [Moniliophthora roreri MCA 2997]|uniref:Uncharacterized protein n=1 Tax=Moniliophthora roreri (strain MCA 2997) TaxID=1381753 RepID=V2X112_MONRO|nr:hypothetical protein Moror_9881 [Moniliophthora roreri MCA 2997]
MSVTQDSLSKVAASGSNGDIHQAQTPVPFPSHYQVSSTNSAPGTASNNPPNGQTSIEVAAANFRPSPKDVISGIAPHVFDERRRRRRRSSSSPQRRVSRPPLTRSPSQRSFHAIPSCESSPLRLSVAIATVDGLEIILNSTELDPRKGSTSTLPTDIRRTRSPPPPKPVFSDTQPKAKPEAVVTTTPKLASEQSHFSRRWKSLHVLKSLALKLR